MCAAKSDTRLLPTLRSSEYDDEQRDTVLNPVLLMEVLSPSTEAYDRGKKFEHYRRIVSLREYLLVAQDAPHIEHFLRNDDQTWTLTEVAGLEATLTLVQATEPDGAAARVDTLFAIRTDRAGGRRVPVESRYRLRTVARPVG